jgi:RNA polymerase sigma-70 factor (ECF subfamily)
MPPPSSRTDHELMEAVQRGDTASLDALFTRHHERLFSFLSRWTGDAHTAEDLVQETFLKLLHRPERYHHEGEFLAWLFRVARNLAVDGYRERHPETGIDSDAVLADDRPLALDRLTTEERQNQLEDALAALPLAHREVLLLRGINGLGARDIGLVLNCTEGAARVRLHRATAALRQAWHARHGDDDAPRT